MTHTRIKYLISGIAICLLGIVSACTSSEELLHPKSYKLAKKNPDFVDLPITSGSTTLNAEGLSYKRKPVDPGEADALQEKYSRLMKVNTESIKSLLLYSFIDEWYGVRYRLGGNDKSGIDCSAFARRLYEEVFRINLLRTSIEQYNICKFFTDKEELMEGDLVFFRIRGKRISHVGVYLMNNYFVHASISGGIMISSLNDPYWSKRYAGAGYIPKKD